MYSIRWRCLLHVSRPIVCFSIVASHDMFCIIKSVKFVQSCICQHPDRISVLDVWYNVNESYYQNC